MSPVNGICNFVHCSYSYPNDMYTKGNVVVDDTFVNWGFKAVILNDECSGSNAVIERLCNRGDYSEATYNCPKGCVDGTCIK